VWYGMSRQLAGTLNEANLASEFLDLNFMQTKGESQANSAADARKVPVCIVPMHRMGRTE
jgi:hypothetical protein